jgi:hypothetical protein
MTGEFTMNLRNPVGRKRQAFGEVVVDQQDGVGGRHPGIAWQAGQH